MSEGVTIAIISAFQVVIVALLGLLGVWVGKIGKDAGAARVNSAAARAQVENDHATNLREENDSRHAETTRWFAELRKDIGGIRQELRDDRRANSEVHQLTAERLTTLEQKA